MIFLLIVAILFTILGAALTLAIQWHYINSWFLKQPVKTPTFSFEAGLPKYQLPKELKEFVDKNNSSQSLQQQSCLALNLFFQFLYKELKDTKKVRRWIMKRLSMEFEELLQKTTTGKLIDQITIRDLALGTQFPVIKDICASNIQLNDSQEYIEEMDIVMDLEYSGGFQLSVDVDLVLGRSAHLAVQITRLTGKARLQLTRNPFTHWSIAFSQEPAMEFKVESQFQGRPLPQITSIIIGQIRRAIKKKHTLPNYKVRFKPFFEKQDIPSNINEIKNTSFAGSQLEVNVIECSRLIRNGSNLDFYCTLAMDSVAWMDLILPQSVTWLLYDFEITKLPTQDLGIIFKQEFIPTKNRQCVIIENIVSESPASTVDLRKRDLLVSINGVRINSFNQTAKLLRQHNNKLLIRIERAAHLRNSQSHEMLTKFDEQILSLKDVDPNLAGEEDEDFINIKLKNEDNENSSPNSRTPTHGSPVKKMLLSAQTNLFNKQKNLDPNRSLLEATLDRRRKSDGYEILNKISPEKYSTAAQSESSYEEQLRKNTDMKKTGLINGPNPVWQEKFKFEMSESDKYLNVIIWCKKLERNEKNLKMEKDRGTKIERDVQLGQISIPLLDIILECATNSQGFHQQTYRLQPPELKPTASRFYKLSSHPGFDESLCYGDVTLAFLYKVDLSPKCSKKPTAIPSSVANDLSDDEIDSVTDETVKEKDISSTSIETKAHEFEGSQFKTATSCHFCSKKIWLKVAFQCKYCKMISHKKCVSKCQLLTICTLDGAKLIPQTSPLNTYSIKKPEIITTDTTDENPPELAEMALASTENQVPGSECSSCSPPGSPKNQRCSIPNLLINLATTAAQARTGLMRVGSAHNLIPPCQQFPIQSKSLPPSPQYSPLSSRKSSLQDNPFLINDDSEIEDDVELTVQRLLQHPNDEILVSAAKKMGKELYTGLELEERKAKLNAMIKKVQLEIDAEATNRNELSKDDKSTNDPAQKMRIMLQISKSDERSRALAVLLLHYYAGMQHCQEIEENEKYDTASTEKEPSDSNNSMEFKKPPDESNNSENKLPL